MNDERYDLDGVLLAHADAPAHLPDFEERLAAGLDEADAEMRRAGRSRLRLPSLWYLRSRHPIVAAAAVLAVCALVAAAVLVGLPVTSHVTGPEPVSAAEVMQRMLHALSTAKTLQADSTDWLRGITPSGGIRYIVTHRRVYWSSDGSTRFVLLDKPEQRPVRLRDRPDENDFAHDAAHGVYYDYLRGWDPDVRTDGAYIHRFTVVRQYPLGPPDAPSSVTGYDFSATARAQEAAHAATVTTTTYEGRPAWVVSISTRKLMGRLANAESLKRWAPPVSGDEIGLTTVDQQTGLPVRFQVIVGGVLQFEYRWSDIRIDEPLPPAAFTVHRPRGAKLIRIDAGYRRLPVPEISALSPRTAMVPEWIPGGYVKAASALASTAYTSTWTTTNPASYGKDVVALKYVRGFDNLTVTTRIAGNPAMARRTDPVMDDTVWVDLVGKDVTLTKGWFAGATARVVSGPRVTTPHLWVVKEDLMLTVAGGATAEELITVAESMRPYASTLAPSGE
jgi:hypothetical protein